ncbi:nucleotidyltransferase family protein [Mesoaciditoga sp.]
MICIAMLAAGMSRRFGKQKLEYPYNGKPILQWTLDKVRNYNVRKLLIFSKELDLSRFDLKDFEIVENKAPQNGLSSSVKLAISRCMKSKGVLFFLGDMPEIKLESIEKTILLGEKNLIAFPNFNGIKGFPVFLPSKYFSEALKISGDVGLRKLIKAHMNDVASFEDDWSCVFDVDTVKDLKDANER